MRYIRTKNGIYDTKLLVKCNDERFENGWFTKNGAPIIAIKQADTIEELCDGFVGITTKLYRKRPDIEPDIYYFQKPFELIYGNVLKQLKLKDVELKNQNGWTYPTMEWFKTCDIYGFIRIDKGLIYVAKMNNKGELESGTEEKDTTDIQEEGK